MNFLQNEDWINTQLVKKHRVYKSDYKINFLLEQYYSYNLKSLSYHEFNSIIFTQDILIT